MGVTREAEGEAYATYAEGNLVVVRFIDGGLFCVVLIVGCLMMQLELC